MDTSTGQMIAALVPDSDLSRVAVLGFLLLLVMAAAEFVRKSHPSRQEVTRKLVHMATGMLVAAGCLGLQSNWPLAAISLFFVGFNILALRYGWLSGMHDTLRPTLGTVFYPSAFLVLLLWLWDDYRGVIIIAMLIMAVGDAAAALVGRRMRRPQVYRLGAEAKTLQGSITMFLASLAIALFGLCFLLSLPHSCWRLALMAVAAALVATACESLSFSGSDNLTVPLGSAFVLHYLISHSALQADGFLLGVGLSLLLAWVSVQLRFLTAGGAVTMFLLGVLIFGSGRWMFALPILTFFILSSLLAGMGKKAKQRYSGLIEKSGSRDAAQVLANGGVAGLILLIWHFNPAPVLFLLYGASVAAGTADTWATELGLLSKSSPRSILTFQPVPPGTSGGLSWVGTLGAALGSLVLSSLSIGLAPAAVLSGRAGPAFLIMASAGFLASLVDSLLGATVQARFVCDRCGKATEKQVHCDGEATRLVGGARWMNNDVVNVLAALSGALLAWLGASLV